MTVLTETKKAPARECAAVHCRAPIPPHLLYCVKHWVQLPRSYKSMLVATYPLGWLLGGHPGTPEWYRALDEVTKFLADRG